MVIVKHGQQAVVQGLRGTFGTVIGYALQVNAESTNPRFQEDPIAAYTRAAEKGHAVYWFIRAASVMTSDRDWNARHNAEWDAAPQLQFGDEVMLDGVTFKLRPDHNQNVRLERTSGL
jgi:hypothetical protein